MTPAEQHAYDAARFAELVESAAPAQWSNPSPIASWTARDVLDHLLEWLPGLLSSAGIEFGQLPHNDPANAWRQRTAEVQNVIETQGETVLENANFPSMPVAAAINQFYTADIWMHSWDLGTALGLEVDLGEQRCAAALAGMEPMDDMLRASGQFGPRVDVPDEASAQDQFIAFIGRDPYWQPS